MPSSSPNSAISDGQALISPIGSTELTAELTARASAHHVLRSAGHNPPLQTQLTEQHPVERADGQQRYSETSTRFLWSLAPNVLSDILSGATVVHLKQIKLAA